VSVKEALGLAAVVGVCVGETVPLAVGEKTGVLTAVLRGVGTPKKGLSGSLGLFREGLFSQNGKAWTKPGRPNNRNPITKRHFMAPNPGWNQEPFEPPGESNASSPIRIPTSLVQHQIHFFGPKQEPCFIRTPCAAAVAAALYRKRSSAQEDFEAPWTTTV
jgi:hypothetical protein